MTQLNHITILGSVTELDTNSFTLYSERIFKNKKETLTIRVELDAVFNSPQLSHGMNVLIDGKLIQHQTVPFWTHTILAREIVIINKNEEEKNN